MASATPVSASTARSSTALTVPTQLTAGPVPRRRLVLDHGGPRWATPKAGPIGASQPDSCDLEPPAQPAGANLTERALRHESPTARSTLSAIGSRASAAANDGGGGVDAGPGRSGSRASATDNNGGHHGGSPIVRIVRGSCWWLSACRCPARVPRVHTGRFERGAGTPVCRRASIRSPVAPATSGLSRLLTNRHERPMPARTRAHPQERPGDPAQERTADRPTSSEPPCRRLTRDPDIPSQRDVRQTSGPGRTLVGRTHTQGDPDDLHHRGRCSDQALRHHPGP